MTNEEKAMEEGKMTDKEKIRTEDLEKVAIQQCYELLKDETIVIDGYEFVVLSDADRNGEQKPIRYISL